jgi:hypothetical protein
VREGRKINMAGRDARRAERQITAERITVGLIPRTVEELDELQRDTGLSKTDLVNRAISLYAFVTERIRGGSDLLLRDRVSGEGERVHLL